MSDTTPTISFSGRSRDASSFLNQAPARKQQAHGLRVRKIAEQMHITPGTSRLGQQTNQERWVAAPEIPEAHEAIEAAYEDGEVGEDVESTPAYWEASIPKKTKWQIDHKSLANDEFYEGDPFLEEDDDEEDYGQEVGVDDVEEAWEEEAVEEEEPVVPLPRVVEQTRSATTGGKIVSQTVAKPVVAKPAAPKAVTKDPDAPKADWELFKVAKFNEADMRDTGAKAVCRVKHLLRQPGAQSDGRPSIPTDWDTRFKPVLGAFKRFILTRPDQFRIITGAEPGRFTIAIVPQKIVQAPDKGKGKKGKGKGKDGKGKDGKGKSWDDGKGKSWGKAWGKGKKGKDGKEKGKTPWTGAQAWGSGAEAAAEPVETENVTPPTRAVRLLAAAARDALADESAEMEQETLEEAVAETAEPDEAGDEDAEMEWPADEEGEEEAPDEDPIEKLYKPAAKASAGGSLRSEASQKPPEDDDDDDFDSSSQHGRFISSLLTGLGSLGAKRPRLVA